ncbi:DUF378 domain-containing protein [Chelatococcus sambhunathii]|uniref:DUF378 domain-containing protein n=1 Tax=Chelatococcus sambhunathii TaxID=363953 RepID=A0ABU1DC45_9HYPH|nr:DUF378 domain-containing protein [Chelatococcus sambhunathii]MDR4305678.1 DUF378 domain-containing protein [Chelatococcus sambhunathii]
MHVIRAIALVLLIVGGLNWGLVGLFQFDLVAAIFGAGSLLARVVYVLVGLAALISFGPLLTETKRAGSGHAGAL